MLGIRRMYRFLNAHIMELCGVKKGLEERIDEGMLQLFSHLERMERDRIDKSLCRSVLVVLQWGSCGR